MKKIPIVVREGWYNMPPINKEKYVARTGLEGPFQTRNGKVVYYDPVEGSYYDPDSDIYLSYDEYAALNEKLGNKDQQAAGFTRVSSTEFTDFCKRTGAEWVYNMGAAMLNGEEVGYRREVDRERDRIWYDYFVRSDLMQESNLPPHLSKFVGTDGDFTPDVKKRLGADGERRLLTKKMGTISKDVTPKGFVPDEPLQETNGIHATYLFSLSLPDYDNQGAGDTQYIKMNFVVPSGGVAHPEALKRQIQEHPKFRELRERGYINFKTIASWRGDLEAELAAAQDKLASGKNWLPSYASELKRKVAALSAANEIISSNEILEALRPEQELDNIVKNFLNKKSPTGMVEAGPFNYGGKKPRRGSVAANAAEQRKKDDHSVARAKEIDKIGSNHHYVGNAKVTKETVEDKSDPCWDDYRQVGMKTKGGKQVPNCVPESQLSEVSGGTVVKTVNGYPIHDMGAAYPHKNKRFLIRDPKIDVWKDSDSSLAGAIQKAKSYRPAGPATKTQAQNDHEDWQEQSRNAISSGEVRRAVMSRRGMTEAPLLGPQGPNAAIHRAASMDQSDREYAIQRWFKNKWKAEHPGQPWPGYEKAGFSLRDYDNTKKTLENTDNGSTVRDSIRNLRTQGWTVYTSRINHRAEKDLRLELEKGNVKFEIIGDVGRWELYRNGPTMSGRGEMFDTIEQAVSSITQSKK
jgi:hypothetical protein